MPHYRLSPELRASLLAMPGAQRRRLSPRAGLFSSGQLADEVFLVLAGVIKRERLLNKDTWLLNHNTCVIQIAGPDCLVGYEALNGQPMYTCNASAVVAAEVLAVPVTEFFLLCEAAPQHWRSILAWQLEHQVMLENRLQNLCSVPVSQRILLHLQELAEILDEEPTYATIPISQGELASYIGATRETTSTALNVLEREGVLSLHHRSITVLRSVRTEQALAMG